MIAVWLLVLLGGLAGCTSSPDPDYYSFGEASPTSGSPSSSDRRPSRSQQALPTKLLAKRRINVGLSTGLVHWKAIRIADRIYPGLGLERLLDVPHPHDRMLPMENIVLPALNGLELELIPSQCTAKVVVPDLVGLVSTALDGGNRIQPVPAFMVSWEAYLVNTQMKAQAFDFYLEASYSVSPAYKSTGRRSGRISRNPSRSNLAIEADSPAIYRLETVELFLKEHKA